MRHVTIILSALLFHLTAVVSEAQSFVSINAGITALSGGSGSWGDYDNDKDLDLLITGETSGGATYTKVFINGEGTFTDSGIALAGVKNGRSGWVDYDNDGDLDICITGENPEQATFLYSNDNGVFTPNTGIDAYFGPYSSAAWGDYDADGDPDLFLTGGWSSALFVNDGSGIFTESGIAFAGLSSGRAAWADMDGDMDLDLVLTGDTGGGMKLFMYTNEGQGFTENELPGMGLSAGSLELGDYDSDGDPDLLIMGFNDMVEPQADIFRNDGGMNFTNIWAGLAPVTLGRAAWGDYDNDGDLDLALSGKLSGCGVYTTDVYENQGNDSFNSINAGLLGAELSYVAWGDYDNDSDLDLFVSGSSYSGGPFSKIYRNDGGLPNFMPDPPQNLTATVSGQDVILGWDEGNDTQTPAAGLSYNIRIGTSPLESDLLSPMAHIDDGFRKIPATGNIVSGNSCIIRGLDENTTYFWSVQTIDNTFAASAFAPEQSFTLSLTGMERVADHGVFHVGPNPATETVTFHVPERYGMLDVEIFGLTGEKIMTFSASDGYTLDVGNLLPGLYFIRTPGEQQADIIKLSVH